MPDRIVRKLVADDVRKGDTIHYEGEWRDVHYAGWRTIHDENGIRSAFIIECVKLYRDWDWASYPTYGYQPSDDYEDQGKPILPFDCQDEFVVDPKMMLDVSFEPDFCKPNGDPFRHWVNVYEVDRAFGGREEGGWWYNTGELIMSIPCDNYEMACEVQDKMREEYPRTGKSSSVAYRGGDYDVSIDKFPGKSYPESRPRYS